MTRKTESLSYPKNPLVALRELQELNDLPPVASGNDSTAIRAAEALPQSSATSSVVAPADGSDSAHATSSVSSSPESSETAEATGSDDGSETSSATQTRKRKPATRTKDEEPADDSVATDDPLAAAVRQMLSRPYTADPRRGPFTVSTVKMPTEVSERLGWVATLTGKAKQEILAEALKDYFAKVLREG
jgi:hypothetical protein